MDSVRRAVWAVDPGIPLAEIETLEDLVRRARARLAFTTLMLLVASGVAMLLAAVGTYGVIAYLVARRRTEIGVRMALGARRVDVHRLVLREGLVLAALGGAIGLVVAAALARTMRAVLFQVDPLDPIAFVVGPAVLLAIAVVACAGPAHRAAGVSPVEALRAE